MELEFEPSLTRSVGGREPSAGISSGLHVNFSGIIKNRADVFTDIKTRP